MGELQAQVHQSDQDPVAKDQPIARSGPLSALPPMPAALLQRVLVDGDPGIGKLGGQLTKVLPGDPGEARMGEGCTSPCWRSRPGMIVRPRSCLHDSLNWVLSNELPSTHGKEVDCDPRGGSAASHTGSAT